MFKDNVCTSKIVLITMKLFKIFMQLCHIIIPILVVIILSLALYKYIINPNDETRKKLLYRFRNSLIGLLVVFLLPVALNYLFTALKPDEYYLSACWDESDTEVNLLYESNNDLNRITYKVPELDYTVLDNDNTSANTKVLPVAEKIWHQVVNGDFHYNAENTEQIPIKGNLIDCSSYVSWVLYEMGYKDFAGGQHRTRDFMKTDWHKKYGWTEISVAAGEDVTNKVKPGDIVVRTNVAKNGKVGYGHVSIVAAVKDGNVYSYDCGDESLWRNSKGGPQNMTWFMKDDRPGKIIRIS